MTLDAQLEQARTLMKQGEWAAAENKFLQLTRMLPSKAAIWQNLAICALSQGKAAMSLQAAQKAITIDRHNWKAKSIAVKSLRAQGKIQDALTMLTQALEQHRDISALKMDGVSLMMNEVGDAASALAYIPHKDPEYREDAILTTIVSAGYDRPDSVENQVLRIKAFAQRYIMPWALPGLTPTGAPAHSGKLRVGLLSPFFGRTPVYYLTIGSLQRLAPQVELFFFDRMAPSANSAERQAFKSLADNDHWVTCAQDDPHALAQRLSSFELDVLFDLGGWSDVNGLKALASKPARRLYKWVGGQSFTTGLSVFDGWLTDEAQSTSEHQAHHTEPLVFCPSGYATYTAPSNLWPRLTPEKGVLGIAANPLKVSRAFIGKLVHRLVEDPSIQVRFIHKSYSLEAAKTRILAQMGPYAHRATFLVPTSHEHYLQCLTGVAAILDTFPYTSGLTALEALYQGVPILTEPGELFCERHGYAHVWYSAQPSDVEVQAPKPGANYLTQTQRLNHAVLAEFLLSLIHKST